MQIQINTDDNIEGGQALAGQIRSAVESALSRISARVTRVEVHLSDENNDKRGQQERRCMMEARLEGRQPLAVTHEAETTDKAVEGASGKLARLIESTLAKVDAQTRRRA